MCQLSSSLRPRCVILGQIDRAGFIFFNKYCQVNFTQNSNNVIQKQKLKYGKEYKKTLTKLPPNRHNKQVNSNLPLPCGDMRKGTQSLCQTQHSTAGCVVRGSV